MAEEQSYCKSIVKKQQQAELIKLPRHHPLVREVHSDDGMQVLLHHFPVGATSPPFPKSHPCVSRRLCGRGARAGGKGGVGQASDMALAESSLQP